MMKHKQILLPLAAAVAFLVPISSFATTAAQPQKKAKAVKFTLHNSTNKAVVLKTGDSTMKLEAGQSRVVKAVPRTRVVTAEPSEAGDAGTVVGEVSDRMDGATMNVR
jgi:hypothetical protein